MEAHVSHMYGPKYAMCVWWSMRWSVVSVEWSSSSSKAAAMTLPVVRVRPEVFHGRSEVEPAVEKIVAKTAAEALKSRLTYLRRHSQDPAVLYGLPPGSRGTHIQGGAFIPSYYLTQS